MLAEGVYIPMTNADDQSRHVIPVPEFRLAELGRKPALHPRLRDVLFVDVGVFGSGNNLSLNAAEILKGNLDQAFRGRSEGGETGGPFIDKPITT